MDKQRKRSRVLQDLLILVLAVAIVTILLHLASWSSLSVSVSFDPDPTVTRSPLMGFAPDARNVRLCEQSDLVFIELRWADWEPEEGVFDIQRLESRFNVELWKQENKHAVLRFVCDLPGDFDHLDIPQWLYEQTGDGTHYDTALGKGYSPDYSNERFREAHQKALQKLSEYCSKDSFVAFVELGSVGHWGEWHAQDADDRSLMPDAAACDKYVQSYVNCFPNAKLLMRRNYEIAVSEQLGFYNDMFGNLPATEEWLTWLRSGGSQETAGLPLMLQPVEQPGRTAPVGGELASDVPMEEVLGENFGALLSSLTASGVTFLGPNVPDLCDARIAGALDSILRRMGYRIYVSELQMQYSFVSRKLNISLTWTNSGNAGFFFDWPVTLYLYDANREPVYWEELNLDLRELNARDRLTVQTQVSLDETLRDEFYLGIGITDYSGSIRLPLAYDMGEDPLYIGDTQILYHYQKEAN